MVALLALKCPNISTVALPEDEQENAQAITSNLQAMALIVERLADTLKLFDFSSANRIPLPKDLSTYTDEARFERNAHNDTLHNWQLIAARSGAIYIYEFHRVEQAMDMLLKTCPALDAMINKEARKRASQIFHKRFKNFADLRLFAAHGSEMVDSPKKRKSHATTKSIPGLVQLENSSVVVTDALMGRRYSSTIKGEFIGYELSIETLNTLISVFNERVAMLKPAEEITSKMIFERMRQKQQPPS